MGVADLLLRFLARFLISLVSRAGLLYSGCLVSSVCLSFLAFLHAMAFSCHLNPRAWWCSISKFLWPIDVFGFLAWFPGRLVHFLLIALYHGLKKYERARSHGSHRQTST